MYSTWKKVLCAITILMAVVAGSYGQSLGDVARQERQKQQSKKGQTAPKVITNEEIPEHPQEATDESKAEEPPSSKMGSKTSEQWKTQIQAQKQVVSNLQGQIDRLNSSIHFVEANRYWNGVQYNQRQEQKQEQVQRMKDQLAQQQKKLEDMQEAARKDGYGNAVYDP